MPLSRAGYRQYTPLSVLHFPDNSDLLSFSDLQDVVLEIWGEL